MLVQVVGRPDLVRPVKKHVEEENGYRLYLGGRGDETSHGK